MPVGVTHTAGFDARPGVQVTPADVDAYLEALEARGRRAATTSVYAAKLRLLLSYLAGEQLGEGTLLEWRSYLLEEGYSPRTVNSYLSAANGLVGFLGRRDLQLTGQLESGATKHREPSRSNYLRLLSFVRGRGDMRDYLLIKSIALLGLSVSELSLLTVEAVRAGGVRLPGPPDTSVAVPDVLAREIMDYAARQGLEEGPVFLGRTGSPLSRTSVAARLRAAAMGAGLPPDACGPGALASLRRKALVDIEASLSSFVTQSYDRILDVEQALVGWNCEVE